MNPPVILLVEDNADEVALTRLAFRENHLFNRLEVAQDGIEALDCVFGRGKWAGRPIQDAPSLVLLDLKLPRMGGVEVIRTLRLDPLSRMLPLVVLTSSAEESDRRACYQAGANSYICKPVEFDRFSRVVRDLGQYWLELNQPPPAAREAAERPS